MANIDMKRGGSVVGFSDTSQATPGVVSIKLTGADAVAAKGGALAANDIIYVCDIPAGARISGATLNVITADTGTTLTFDLGDGTAADEWVDGADGTTTGFAAEGTNGVFSQQKLYTSADVLDLKVATASSADDNWEVEVLFELVDYSGNPRAKTLKEA